MSQAILDQAEACVARSDRLGAIALLKGLLKRKVDKKLSTRDRSFVRQLLARQYLIMNIEHVAAQRLMQEAIDFYPEPSYMRAFALFMLGAAMRTKDGNAALRLLTEAGDIALNANLDGLLADDIHSYAIMVLECGDAKRRFGDYAGAHLCFDTVTHKFADHMTPVTKARWHLCMGLLDRDMGKWSEAYMAFINACQHCDEIVEEDCGDYMDNVHVLKKDCLVNAADMLRDFKQYEMACTFYEKLRDLDALIKCRALAALPRREDVESGDGYRLCSRPGCHTVQQWMPICTGCCTAWYCGTKCQLEHWPQHKPHCMVCTQCETPLDRDATIKLCSMCI